MSLIETYKTEIRAKLPNPLERDEWRFTRYGGLTAVKEMTASPETLATADIKAKALISEGRALKVPVFKIGDIAIKNQRSCTVAGLDNTTEKVDVNWVTLVADIGMKKSEYQKNEVSYLEDLNRKLLRVEHGFSKAVEQMIFTRLEADKSAVNASPLVGSKYPVVGNALQVAEAQQKFFFNDLETIMEGDDFYSSPYKVIGSSTTKPMVRQWANQGQANSENSQFQFAGFDFRYTNHITLGTNKKAAAYAMTDGSLCILTRVNVDAEMGNKTHNTEWSKTSLDTFGFEVGVMYQSECKDLSAQAGLEHLKASAYESFQFSIDVALLSAYNSDKTNKAGAIKKVEFL